MIKEAKFNITVTYGEDSLVQKQKQKLLMRMAKVFIGHMESIFQLNTQKQK